VVLNGQSVISGSVKEWSMIISKAPLRISFTGGGSDIPAYYRHSRGAVLSTSIDKFVYVNINTRFERGIRLAYSKTEDVSRASDLDHKIVREGLLSLGIENGIEITTIADVPSKGTGLGSSSSFTVALLLGLNAYLGRYVSRQGLAEESCKIEIELCKEPIGKQDQYAAAYGGLNLIEFDCTERVSVTPVIANRQTVKTIESNLLMFFTGITRSASEILRKQQAAVAEDMKKFSTLNRMVDLTYALAEEIRNNNPDALGEALHENWSLKRTLEKSVSNTQIDEWYEVARRHGAVGGKILGAGAGGFLLFYAPRERHSEISRALEPLRRFNFSFDRDGSRIIFFDQKS